MKHLVTYRPPIRVGLALLAVASVATAFAFFTQRTYGSDQDIAKLNRIVQGTTRNTASMQLFREGRDFIEAQNWQKAAEKFNDFIAAYPKDKDLDAALYWYGYALQKQGRTEAKDPLIKLITKFPNSNWRSDAQGLLVVMGEKAAVEQALERDNCEIKILALQSLFQADEERAIALVTESLRANTGQCQGYQAAAVSMIGSHGGPKVVPLLLDVARTHADMRLRLTAIKRLGEQHNDQVADELIKIYEADRTKEIRTQILRALIQSRSQRGTAKVFEIARTGDDLAMRQSAIRYIGELKDSASLDELIRLYDTDKTTEIRSQVLRALSGRDDARARTKLLEIARSGETPELRIEAMRRLGDHGRITIEDLIQLYTSEQNLQIKQALLRVFADRHDDPGAHSKLMEVARGNEAVELRTYAIRQLGQKDDEQTVGQLLAMYDSEQNIQIRTALLRAFGDSKQKTAVRKLMTIARNDQSVELRKTAVRYLGESKDPEALKFLEELLK
jgi:HEAT repeat protein